MTHPSRPKLLAWETTRACLFTCSHCRASAIPRPMPDELNLEEGRRLMADAAQLGPWIIILSGGEPLLRPDLEDLARAGIDNGHTVVVACNDGHLLSEDRISSLKSAGVRRFSFSMHFPQATGQDHFLGRAGAFDENVAAFARLQKAGIGFQINTTVLPANRLILPQILEKAKSWGASAWHLFFVVPIGRAGENTPEAASTFLNDQETEEVLNWVAETADEAGIPVKVTCAPHYARVRAQKRKAVPHGGAGCMAGRGFAFVSSTGEVKPCGYFDQVLGNVREQPFNRIYSESPLLQSFRQPEGLKGSCGACAYRNLCGGCRARANARHGDPLASDPACHQAVLGTAENEPSGHRKWA